ncbi:MAG: type II secretion system minor pseudopilin GspK [Acidiferrobacterales bacterium]
MTNRYPATLASQREAGFAVVTALLIVAVVATVAAFLALGQQVWLRQAQNLADRAQADAVRGGAVEWAAIILTLDARDNSTDDLTQTWAQVLPPLPAEGGFVTGKIIDVQGRFNLNNLLQQENPSADDLALFQRLLQNLELPAELADSLVDWMDSNSTTQPNGAEDIDYLASDPPHRAANRELQNLEELGQVKGFNAEVMNKLRPLITVLPEATAININTASAELLQAMFADLSLSEAEDLVGKREDEPFTQADDLKKHLPPDAALPKVRYDVRSAYFEVSVATLFGRLQRRSHAMLHRPTNAPVEILWQQQQLVVPESSDDTS